ncbi:hypothetical protein LSG31_00310 [Fodinisporobacter ferrooxydans]|uniref:Gp5/Type VI secretion system Vgr protein OB-fold domain-containing protein n=1 Tax=Fodinisporobacter ferrooxydans TaxID=2901836 RepID=A0ABY4CJR8_9BACL|nr:hypothetical protein LSG31_00310 [Alicyclobacillaceae bacterium MYW30-H2]
MKIGNSVAHKHSHLQQTNIINPKAGLVYEGKVIQVNPNDSSVDVRLYDGQILRNVRVLFPSANTIAGFRYLVSIQNNNPQNSEKGIIEDGQLTHIQDTLATIVYVQGFTLAPRCIGFSFPNDAQMHIDEQGLAMFRHESGVYSLTDKSGHHEIHFPDGSYMIMAEDTNPRTLTSGEQVQPWNPPTTTTPYNLTINLAQQGITISVQNGNVTISGAKQIQFSAHDSSGDSASLTINGAGSVTASKTISGTTTNATIV